MKNHVEKKEKTKIRFQNKLSVPANTDGFLCKQMNNFEYAKYP